MPVIADTLDLFRVVNESFVATTEYHKVLALTNDRAARRAKEDDDADLPVLVCAERQTAGRGRGSNRWWTGPGSLAFSLLASPEQVRTPADHSVGLVSLAVGAAVVEALAPLVHDRPIGLHWPNDVMVGEQKLAGILAEVVPRRRWVIGIGVNVNGSAGDAPPELRPRLTTLRDLSGKVHSRTDVLLAILRRLAAGLETLSHSPEETTSRADAMCLQRGRTLTVQQGDRTITGACAGIARDGALLLEAAQGGHISIYSGVVQSCRSCPDHP